MHCWSITEAKFLVVGQLGDGVSEENYLVENEGHFDVLDLERKYSDLVACDRLLYPGISRAATLFIAESRSLIPFRARMSVPYVVTIIDFTVFEAFPLMILRKHIILNGMVGEFLLDLEIPRPNNN